MSGWPRGRRAECPARPGGRGHRPPAQCAPAATTPTATATGLGLRGTCSWRAHGARTARRGRGGRPPRAPTCLAPRPWASPHSSSARPAAAGALEVPARLRCPGDWRSGHGWRPRRRCAAGRPSRDPGTWCTPPHRCRWRRAARRRGTRRAAAGGGRPELLDQPSRPRRCGRNAPEATRRGGERGARHPRRSGGARSAGGGPLRLRRALGCARNPRWRRGRRVPCPPRP
mmetsp:Transcript_18581/g.49929  ORF Transcript_18581/g.49929 Transcript_18581/m.49929 type:complete len:229 (-) Transcript_18581:282-968(-)